MKVYGIPEYFLKKGKKMLDEMPNCITIGPLRAE